MSQRRKALYKYRAFNTATLDSLCLDTLYFANPGTFNDPLDCNPAVKCDSDLKELRTLLTILAQRRISAEVLESLKRARLPRDKSAVHAHIRARDEAAAGLAEIAYHATNPEYEVGEEQAEAWLLTQEIERELHRHYDRGVCCFSTTYASPLLWSHYGDQHQGLCIGYGTERTPVPRPKRVIYGGSRAVKTSTLVRAFVHDDRKAKERLDRSVLLRKARGWGYEREWRLIGSQGIHDSPLLMKEITFGLRCHPSVKHAVVRALEGRDKPVRFYQIHEVRNRYVLHRRTLEFDEPAWLPRTAASGEEIFGRTDAK